MKILALAVTLLSVAALSLNTAQADPVLTPYLGLNAVAFDGASKLPSDFEAGGGGSISLSPHISAVGGAWYGLGESYLRANIGGRITVSDVNEPNLSMGVGVSYNASSKPSVRPQELCGDAVIGWRPYPQTAPKVTLGASASYGFESTHAFLTLAVRYQLSPL
jgi:hypothetical protein